MEVVIIRDRVSFDHDVWRGYIVLPGGCDVIVPNRIFTYSFSEMIAYLKHQISVNAYNIINVYANDGDIPEDASSSWCKFPRTITPTMIVIDSLENEEALALLRLRIE